MSGPIRPEHVADAKVALIPDFVFDAFNEAITAKFSGGRATVNQEDVIRRIQAKSSDTLSRSTIFDNNWLDVEEAYQAAGWYVQYEKPGYNETGASYFTFKRNRHGY